MSEQIQLEALIRSYDARLAKADAAGITDTDSKNGWLYCELAERNANLSIANAVANDIRHGQALLKSMHEVVILFDHFRLQEYHKEYDPKGGLPEWADYYEALSKYESIGTATANDNEILLNLTLQLSRCYIAFREIACLVCNGKRINYAHEDALICAAKREEV